MRNNAFSILSLLHVQLQLPKLQVLYMQQGSHKPFSQGASGYACSIWMKYRLSIRSKETGGQKNECNDFPRVSYNSQII